VLESLCVNHEGTEYSKYEQHDVLDIQAFQATSFEKKVVDVLGV